MQDRNLVKKLFIKALNGESEQHKIRLEKAETVLEIAMAVHEAKYHWFEYEEESDRVNPYHNETAYKLASIVLIQLNYIKELMKIIKDLEEKK